MTTRTRSTRKRPRSPLAEVRDLLRTPFDVAPGMWFHAYQRSLDFIRDGQLFSVPVAIVRRALELLDQERALTPKRRRRP